jgi:hypothetical protein
LKIYSSNFNYAGAVPGQFLVGLIGWSNQSSFKTGGSWSATTTLSVGYSSPSSVGPLTQSIGFSIVNTSDPDQNPGDNEETGNNYDSVMNFALSNNSFSSPTDIGGGLQVTGYSAFLYYAGDDGDGRYNCSFDGKGSTYNSSTGKWKNCEGNLSKIGIYANVALAPVPLPAAGLLLIGGLTSAVVVARKRKKRDGAYGRSDS